MVQRSIIFLDVDGVLNCSDTWKGPHGNGVHTICPDLCDNFARVVKETGADVVVSSTWRLHQSGLSFLADRLNERGVTILDITPDIPRKRLSGPPTLRGEEIRQWLIENDRLDDRIVILDDDSDFLREQKPFHVKTTFHGKGGLTPELANEAIRILNAKLP